jgi:2-oxoglutarate ferredoxin oxidoreductase subunit gamma
MRHWKVVVAGEGGQGVQALAETLALAAYRAGLHALYIPNFGIEQRGGVSMALVQVSEKEIGAPKFRTAGLVVALSPRSLERTEQYLGPETVILYDSSLVDAPRIADQVVGLQSYDTIAPEAFAERLSYRDQRRAVDTAGRGLVALPASDLARQKLHPRVFNMIILGAIVAVTELVGLEEVKAALEEKLNRRFKQDPLLKEHNFRALELGYARIKETLTV